MAPTLSNFLHTARHLSPEIVLLKYRFPVNRLNGESPITQIRSSIRSLEENEWLVIFHEATPVTIRELSAYATAPKLTRGTCTSFPMTRRLFSSIISVLQQMIVKFLK
jgi:hypothetical protein